MAERILFKKLRDVNTPSRSYHFAAGYDFYIPNDYEWDTKTIAPGESVLLKSGIKMNMPAGLALIFFNKSGQAIKGLDVGACVVDSDYQGEIHLNVWNVSNKDIILTKGQKLIQGVFLELPQTILHEVNKSEELFAEVSARGEKGFGSTDRIHKQ